MLGTPALKVKAAPMPSALETLPYCVTMTGAGAAEPDAERVFLMMPLVRMLTLDLFFACHFLTNLALYANSFVAVDAIVDGGKQNLRGNGCAAVCVALAQE